MFALMTFITPTTFTTVVVPWLIVLGMIFTYWRKGGNAAAESANVSLLQLAEANKAEIASLTKRIETCEGLHRTNLSERGKLEGQISEKDKRIAILESVSLDKNPQTMEFMKSISSLMQEILTFMQEINSHLVEKPQGA